MWRSMISYSLKGYVIKNVEWMYVRFHFLFVLFCFASFLMTEFYLGCIRNQMFLVQIYTDNRFCFLYLSTNVFMKLCYFIFSYFGDPCFHVSSAIFSVSLAPFFSALFLFWEIRFNILFIYLFLFLIIFFSLCF